LTYCLPPQTVTKDLQKLTGLMTLTAVVSVSMVPPVVKEHVSAVMSYTKRYYDNVTSRGATVARADSERRADSPR